MGFENNTDYKSDGSKLSIGIILILGVFLSIAVFVNTRYQGVLDPDSFYHFRHAWLYRTNGLLDSAFPWLEFSTIKLLGADLWYGFHILLIPFTYIANLTVAFKLAGVFVTFFILSALYAALRNIGFRFPELWTIFFMFSSQMVIKRITMVRPHTISLGLAALIISFFIKGSLVAVFISSFFLSWIHASMFWFPALAVSIIIFFQKIHGVPINIKKIFAFLGGITVGLLARPHPLANLKLLYIQLVELTLSKGRELAQTIGNELRPPQISEIVREVLPIIILVIFALSYLIYRITSRRPYTIDKRIIILSSLVLFGISVMMYANARRAIDLLILTAMLFVGVVFSDPIFSKIKANKFLAPIFLYIGVLVFCFINIIHTEFKGQPITGLRSAALWLKDNTKPGETVFNINWGFFPSLFFWNQSNHYTYGMDPVFLLDYDNKLYWKLYNMLVNDAQKKTIWKLDTLGIKQPGGVTCGNDPSQCRPDSIETVPDVLRNDFKAAYVFVRGTASFLAYLEKDKNNFMKVFEDPKEKTLIFKILSPKK